MLDKNKKISLSVFLAIAGLNEGSKFAASKLFGNSDDKTPKSWDTAMKKSRVYDDTPANVEKIITTKK